MQLVLAPEVIKLLKHKLRRAGRREIGGLLMGEHLGDACFRVVKVSVQRSGGNQACFIRDPHDHQGELEKFFEETGRDYTRFNYLGEWHSHPSVKALPSSTDVETMQSIVDDPAVGSNFLVLLVLKLSGRHMEASGLAFRSSSEPVVVDIKVEDGGRSPRWYRWVRAIFRQ